MSGRMTPRVRLFFRCSPLARALGRKSSSRMIFCTRSFVFGWTLWGLLLITRDTVAMQTLAFRATSVIVAIEPVPLGMENVFQIVLPLSGGCQQGFSPFGGE